MGVDLGLQAADLGVGQQAFGNLDVFQLKLGREEVAKPLGQLEKQQIQRFAGRAVKFEGPDHVAALVQGDYDGRGEGTARMAASDIGLVADERGLARFQNRARGVGDDGAAGLVVVVALADVGQNARLVGDGHCADRDPCMDDARRGHGAFRSQAGAQMADRGVGDVEDLLGLDRILPGLVAEDHVDDLPAGLHIPKGHIVSKKKCLEVIPDLATENLHGASVWYDVLAVNTERVVLEYVLQSVNHGALAANYVEATGIEKGADELYHVTVLDKLSQQKHLIKTRFIVNAAGPWLEDCLHVHQESVKKQKWALALNVVSRKKIFADFAVALEGQRKYEDKDALIRRGKRLYFFVPWRGHTMIGTNYEESSMSPDCLQVKREMIQDMVDEINAIYPPAQLKYEDISFFHAGLLPMRGKSEESNIQLEKSSTFFEHKESNFSRVLSVKGVKYTTAPHIAHEIVCFLKKQYPPLLSKQRQKESSSHAGQYNANESALQGMLEKKYGQRALQILQFLRAEQDDDIWIDKDAQLLKAEVNYLISEEMVCTLSDIIFRRTGLGTADRPERKLLVNLSDFMGKILGWDEARKEEEREEVLHRYSPLVYKEA